MIRNGGDTMFFYFSFCFLINEVLSFSDNIRINPVTCCIHKVKYIDTDRPYQCVSESLWNSETVRQCDRHELVYITKGAVFIHLTILSVLCDKT